MAKNGLLFLICLFMFFQCLGNWFTATAAQNASSLKAPTSWNGKMSQTCIFTALEDFYAVNDDYGTRLVLHPKDSKGADAAAAAVVLAAERVVTNHSFQEPTEYKSLKDSSEIDVSEIGPQLLQKISESNFKGLTREVCLVNGQLQPPVFKIINALGGERGVQFRIPTNGISQHPDVRTTKSLRPIIWPEDSITVPHWKKLSIGYPAKQTFAVNIKEAVNHSSNGTLVTHFFGSVVFDEVMEALPYDVPYEFVPLQRANGENEESSSDDLLHQVYLKKHDAVVGDIMITANRSLFTVDFSKPYTDGRVSVFLIVLVVSLSALVLLLLSYILKNSAKKLWKRLVHIVHVELELQTMENASGTDNIVISVDPSKQ